MAGLSGLTQYWRHYIGFCAGDWPLKCQRLCVVILVFLSILSYWTATRPDVAVAPMIPQVYTNNEASRVKNMSPLYVYDFKIEKDTSKSNSLMSYSSGRVPCSLLLMDTPVEISDGNNYRTDQHRAVASVPLTWRVRGLALKQLTAGSDRGWICQWTDLWMTDCSTNVLFCFKP